jgi:hypothetical protein
MKPYLDARTTDYLITVVDTATQDLMTFDTQIDAKVPGNDFSLLYMLLMLHFQADGEAVNDLFGHYFDKAKARYEEEGIKAEAQHFIQWMAHDIANEATGPARRKVLDACGLTGLSAPQELEAMRGLFKANADHAVLLNGTRVVHVFTRY